MNSRQIDDLSLAERKRWNQLISNLPRRDDPRWDEATCIRHSFEWLHKIAEQIRYGEEINKSWKVMRKFYNHYDLIEKNKNTRKTHCHSCFMPIEKREGMVYDYVPMKMDISFCVRCDPQYYHCPICDWPMADGKCLGKCKMEIK